ncbi:hypothetical protein AM588_10009594 [Phytophthora nicotianae]|uniref:Uncharacterized protein n=1 Tax=Phytophthora nicotianae TaxID=4792 RepID=A0A0W8D9X1_PHYNI|nr:hypothetical protein AM588_10009594 [Phytophthora nicotianae]
MIIPDDSVLRGSSFPPRLAPTTLSKRVRERLKELASKITNAWLAIQITHYGGKYSIERMLALEEYTRKTTLFRVLCVVTGTPLPTLALVLCQESIPLQDPAERWSVNYGFWIRMMVLGFGEGCATSIQLRHLLDDMTLSFKQTVLLGISVAVGYTATAMMVASYWTFPIPFVNFILSIVLIVAFVVVVRLILGKQRFQYILSQRKKLRQCVNFLLVQMIMVSIYPAYQFLFDSVLHTRYEIPVLMLLPILKLVLRNIFTFAIYHMEDIIPEQVILTVDFFDAFYLAICMQTSSSITTVIVIMIVDFVQTAVDLIELYQRTREIQTRLGAIDPIQGVNNLLTVVRTRCYGFQSFPASIKIRSCISYGISSQVEEFLNKIEDKQKTKSTHSPLLRSRSMIHVISKATSTPRRLSSFMNSRASVVQPGSMVSYANNMAPNAPKSTVGLKTKSNVDILYESLEVLFTAECLILTEYLETFVPVLYGTYILVMVHLPSAQYHTEMEGVTTENVSDKVQNVFIYATLELASLAVLTGIMWRNCGIRALYQLAFVLETQAALVQSKLMLWVLMTLTYRVTHFGKVNWKPHVCAITTFSNWYVVNTSRFRVDRTLKQLISQRINHPMHVDPLVLQSRHISDA